MEAAHAADPICQQTMPDGTVLVIEPFIDRAFPSCDFLSGDCFLGRDAMVFRNSSIQVRSMQHPADTEKHCNPSYHHHNPSDREPRTGESHDRLLMLDRKSWFLVEALHRGFDVSPFGTSRITGLADGLF
jgi:hypothetical protein